MSSKRTKRWKRRLRLKEEPLTDEGLSVERVAELAEITVEQARDALALMVKVGMIEEEPGDGGT